MLYTSYVLDADGVMATVKDWSTVEESLTEDYHEGSNYRDEFEGSTIIGSNSSIKHGFYPLDGAADDSAPRARLSDEIGHVPPRSEAVKHTRLIFKDASDTIVAQFKPGEWTKWSNEPFRRI